MPMQRDHTIVLNTFSVGRSAPTNALSSASKCARVGYHAPIYRLRRTDARTRSAHAIPSRPCYYTTSEKGTNLPKCRRHVRANGMPKTAMMSKMPNRMKTPCHVRRQQGVRLLQEREEGRER